MAVSFHPITTVEIPLTISSSWAEINVQGYGVPAEATGIILHVSRWSAVSDYRFGLRKNGGSTSSTAGIGAATGGAAEQVQHFYAMIGVDAAGKFEYFIGMQTTQITIYLIGYTTEGVTFYDSAIPVDLSGVSGWTTITWDVPDGTIGMIMEWAYSGALNDLGTKSWYGVRKLGSTDNYYQRQYTHCWAVCGIDGNKKMQLQVENIAEYNMRLWKVGYITTGATFFTNSAAMPEGVEAQNNWYTHDLFDEVPNAFMVFIEYTGGSIDYSGVMKFGETGDDVEKANNTMTHPFYFVALSIDHKIQGKTSSGGLLSSYRIIGYCDAEAPDVTTLDAFNVHSTGAQLAGHLTDDGGQPCDVAFEYGKTVSYGDSTTEESVRTGNSFVHKLTGLDSDTLYHFRAYATNQHSTVYGDDNTFTTAAVAGIPFPTDASTRVTGIRHIYRPGLFRMILSLGDVGGDIDLAEYKVRQELSPVPPEPASVQPSKPEPTKQTPEEMMELLGMGERQPQPSDPLSSARQTVEQRLPEPIQLQDQEQPWWQITPISLIGKVIDWWQSRKENR